MSDVFISYSRKNEDFAKKLIDKLTQSGKDSWVDWEGIPLTAPSWWEEIKTGIDGGDSFVFIMSPQSMASIVCNMELDYAIEQGKRIIPVVYKDVDNDNMFASIADYKPDEAMEERLGNKEPLTIARENWKRLSHINWLFFREEDDFDDGYQTLVDTVETDLDYVKAHTRYLIRAREWSNDRKEDLLLFGEEIERAEAWLQKADHYAFIYDSEAQQRVVNPLPLELQQEYIHVSRAVADERQAQLLALEESRQRSEQSAKKTQRNLTLVATVSLVIIVIAGLFASQQSQNAGAEQNLRVLAEQQVVDAEAETRAAELAQQALNALNDDYIINPEIVALLTIQALNNAYNITADELLNEVLQNLYGVNSFSTNNEPETYLNVSDDESLLLTKVDNAFGATPGFKIRDSETGELIQFFAGIWSSQSLSPDGKTIALSGTEVTDDGRQPLIPIGLWDVETGNLIKEMPDQTGSFYSLNFSPDGRMLLVAQNSQDDHLMQLLDVETGDVIRRFQGQADPLTLAEFTADGERLITRDSRQVVRVWEVNTGVALTAFQGPDTYFAFLNPELSEIAFAISDGDQHRIDIWGIDEGIRIHRFGEQPSLLVSASFHPNGTQIAIGNHDSSIEIRDIESNEVVKTLIGPVDPPSHMKFSSDGSQLISLHGFASLLDPEIRVWNLDQSSPVITAQSDALAELDLSTELQPVLLSGDEDRVIHLWDVQTNEALCTFNSEYPPNIVFNADQSKFMRYNSSWDTAMVIQDINSCDRIQTFILMNHKTNSAILSADGTRVVSGSTLDSIHLWDVSSPDAIRVFEGHEDDVNKVAFSPDETFIISASDDNTIRYWDTETGEMIRILEGHTSSVKTFAISPDGTELLSGDENGGLRLWNLETGELIQTYEIPSNINGGLTRDISFNSDGMLFLSSHAGNRNYLWNKQTGKIIRSIPNGRTFYFTSDNSQVYYQTSRVTQDYEAKITDVDYRDFVAYACNRVQRDLTNRERQQYNVDDTPTCPKFAENSE